MILCLRKRRSAKGRTSDPPSDPRGSSAASHRLKHSVRSLLPVQRMRVETKNKMSDVVSLSDAGSFLVEHMPVSPSVFLVVIIFSQPGMILQHSVLH